MKKFLLMLLTIPLVSCETLRIKTEEVPRLKFEAHIPEPLKLDNVEWVVFTYDGVTYFALDSDNYSKLSINTEQLQSRLYYFHNVIIEQQKYYNN